MISPREALRAALVVLLLLATSAIGRWLAINEPQLLTTFRFVSSVFLLFVTTVLLFKYDQVRSDLLSHRSDIYGLVTEIRDFVRADSEARNKAVAELLARAEVLAAEVALRAEQASQQRHEKITERLDAIEKSQRQDKP